MKGKTSCLTTRNISPASNSRKRDQRILSCPCPKIGSSIGLPSRLAFFSRAVWMSSSRLMNSRKDICSITRSESEIPPVQNASHILSIFDLFSPVSTQKTPIQKYIYELIPQKTTKPPINNNVDPGRLSLQLFSRNWLSFTTSSIASLNYLIFNTLLIFLSQWVRCYG